MVQYSNLDRVMEAKVHYKNGTSSKRQMSSENFLEKINMKKVIISFAVMLATVLTGSAQIFVGGSMGLSHTSAERKDGNNTFTYPTQFGFNISPKIGYELSNKSAVGVNPTCRFFPRKYAKKTKKSVMPNLQN